MALIERRSPTSSAMPTITPPARPAISSADRSAPARPMRRSLSKHARKSSPATTAPNGISRWPTPTLPRRRAMPALPSPRSEPSRYRCSACFRRRRRDNLRRNQPTSSCCCRQAKAAGFLSPQSARCLASISATSRHRMDNGRSHRSINPASNAARFSFAVGVHRPG